MTIQEQIKKAQKRKKEYIRMMQNIKLVELAFARSVATETLNIADLKKRLRNRRMIDETDFRLSYDEKKSIEYIDGYEQGREDAIEKIHTDLITEIAILNETDMTDVNLYTFAVRIKEIADKLKEQK